MTAVGTKTGTAQIARSDRPGFYEDRFVASFVCFAPVEKPEVSVYVVS